MSWVVLENVAGASARGDQGDGLSAARQPWAQTIIRHRKLRPARPALIDHGIIGPPFHTPSFTGEVARRYPRQGPRQCQVGAVRSGWARWGEHGRVTARNRVS